MAMTVTVTSNWPAIAQLFDARSAHSMAALLQAEGIPSAVSPALPGQGGVPMWQVQVAAEQLDLASLLFEKSRLTDAELDYLATGLLVGEGDGK
jgi:hypothetical protein